MDRSFPKKYEGSVSVTTNAGRKWFAPTIMVGTTRHHKLLGPWAAQILMAIADERPAILGGKPVRPQGPPLWPLDDPEVAQALQAALRDRSWGKYHGPNVTRLEEALRSAFGVEHALACGSGTFAVELALRALKIQPGDEVIVAAYDYPGNFLSVHAVGARPVLIDVTPENWNLDVRQLAGAFSAHTRAILVSHLHGGLV